MIFLYTIKVQVEESGRKCKICFSEATNTLLMIKAV